jgi:hypothetical protein
LENPDVEIVQRDYVSTFGKGQGSDFYDLIIFVELSILLKNLRSSFESLRTNGDAVEIMGDFSVHAERVEAFLGFFSRIELSKSDPAGTCCCWSNRY